MVTKCAACGSGDILTLSDRVQCLACHKYTSFTGEVWTGPGPRGTAELHPMEGR